jgi:hypothetical protein
VSALWTGDAKSAQALCVDGIEYEQLILAMANEYQSQHKYCELFKQITGSTDEPNSISIKRAMDDNLEKCAVDFGEGVAHSFWGSYSLRKVNGEWKIVFEEYNFERAATEELDIIRSRPEMYRKD